MLLTATAACSRESSKPVICLDSKEMFESIFEEYQESILMSFEPDTENTKIVLTVNSKTKTWSIVEYNLETACLLGSGNNYKIIGRTRTLDYI